MTTKTDNRARELAATHYSSIVQMLAAVTFDYARLRELRELDECEELAELEVTLDECKDEEEARQIIQDSPLEVQVRSDWSNVGEPLEASEFMLLLCIGEADVRIVGGLNRGEPCSAWLEYRGQGTQWAQWFGASSDILCEYAYFFFGGWHHDQTNWSYPDDLDA